MINGKLKKDKGYVFVILLVFLGAMFEFFYSQFKEIQTVATEYEYKILQQYKLLKLREESVFLLIQGEMNHININHKKDLLLVIHEDLTFNGINKKETTKWLKSNTFVFAKNKKKYNEEKNKIEKIEKILEEESIEYVEQRKKLLEYTFNYKNLINHPISKYILKYKNYPKIDLYDIEK